MRAPASSPVHRNTSMRARLAQPRRHPLAHEVDRLADPLVGIVPTGARDGAPLVEPDGPVELEPSVDHVGGSTPSEETDRPARAVALGLQCGPDRRPG